MKIKNILLVSPMFRELQALIEKNIPDKTFRFMPEEELSQEDLSWADALVSFNLKAEYDYSSVKWIHSLGAGVDRFLHKKDWNQEILLTRTICSFGQRIAEYCLSYILKDLQLHDRFKEQQQQKNWVQSTPKLIGEQKVLVYGTGEIGHMIAKVFSTLGVDVYGVSLSGEEKADFKEVLTVDSHFSVLNEMNYVINTLPLTERTEKLFNSAIFNQLSNSGFINVGRGASIDEEALLQALNDNTVSFAVLDVFEQEPLPNSNPLWNHPRVQITPHISAVTTPSEGAACFLETLKNIDENRPLKNIVETKKGY
ncbi:phosphoglycerate dehydrogenase-like enzyme [Bacillus niacini]|uniref:Phosphoglycerate dehydrogenase-like enzyme n=1 Tax=Neobacillus niacini TaxID=86668 RepID=A0A852TJ22_9BACI|nr:D-2-hydroxyacid dehydrogenase [Neobacillus niacini]NYE07238.1 phosphoglycerate dehydrogenase-like enzyme [Neobacillus niacini]